MRLKFFQLFILAFLFTGQTTFAQVAKNIIVEHFTNTRCSICANPNKNPAFYTNLAAHPEVKHISYHPSSPYPDCVLNQHNTAENDGRTNYYDIFGGTPRLIVQGVLNPNSVAFGSPDVFSPFADQTSEISISIEQTKISNERIEAVVTITTETEHNYINPKLLVGVAEKLVNYAAPNGEQEHHDVFRKAMTDITGDPITLPAVGESIMLTYSVDHNSEWDFSQMFAYAILNDGSDKQVIQSHTASPSDTGPSSITTSHLSNVQIYPNPANDFLTISLNSDKITEAQLYDVYGKLLFTSSFHTQTQLDLSNFIDGIYFLSLKNNEVQALEKVIID